MKSAWLVLGTHLFENHPCVTQPLDHTILIEADNLCRRYKYHKHKLVFMLASMREFHEYLRRENVHTIYKHYAPETTYGNILKKCIAENKITHVSLLETDNNTHGNIKQFLERIGVSVTIYPNTYSFVTSSQEITEWFSHNDNHIMERFYRWQRKRMNILMENGKPKGGIWNYDKENRSPLPLDVSIPTIPFPKVTTRTKEVLSLVNTHFSDNPGTTDEYWLPTTHKEALKWLQTFLSKRLKNFGMYEDAMKDTEPFLFHSALSSLLNNGLLTPQLVLDKTLEYTSKHSIPINSVEGFVRQLIGWREYMRGIYLYYPEMKSMNYFAFTKELESWWYTDEYQNQDLPKPVISALKHVHTYGYTHHIERLMILGNWFLLNEYSPQSVYTWFMSMFVDAYEWVMVGNVIGMSQYADGGVVATKPYISGGNYLQKMGGYWNSIQEAQKSEFTTRYWNFLKNYKHKLKDNPRMNMILAAAEKRTKEQQTK